eukprot:scpid88995/ scgid30656/ 
MSLDFLYRRKRIPEYIRWPSYPEFSLQLRLLRSSRDFLIQTRNTLEWYYGRPANVPGELTAKERALMRASLPSANDIVEVETVRRRQRPAPCRSQSPKRLADSSQSPRQPKRSWRSCIWNLALFCFLLLLCALLGQFVGDVIRRQHRRAVSKLEEQFRTNVTALQNQHASELSQQKIDLDDQCAKCVAGVQKGCEENRLDQQASAAEELREKVSALEAEHRNVVSRRDSSLQQLTMTYEELVNRHGALLQKFETSLTLTKLEFEQALSRNKEKCEDDRQRLTAEMGVLFERLRQKKTCFESLQQSFWCTVNQLTGRLAPGITCEV